MNDEKLTSGIITGGMGTGKTGTARGILKERIARGERGNFVLDSGGGYRQLCESVNGAYLPGSTPSATMAGLYSLGKLHTPLTVIDIESVEPTYRPHVVSTAVKEISRALKEARHPLVIVDEAYRTMPSPEDTRLLLNAVEGANGTILVILEELKDLPEETQKVLFPRVQRFIDVERNAVEFTQKPGGRKTAYAVGGIVAALAVGAGVLYLRRRSRFTGE